MKKLNGITMIIDPLPVYYFQYTIQGMTIDNYFIEAPTGQYEAILGMLQFKRTNPQVNWTKYQIKIKEYANANLEIQEKKPNLDWSLSKLYLTPQNPKSVFYKFEPINHPSYGYLIHPYYHNNLLNFTLFSASLLLETRMYRTLEPELTVPL